MFFRGKGDYLEISRVLDRKARAPKSDAMSKDLQQSGPPLRGAGRLLLVCAGPGFVNGRAVFRRAVLAAEHG